MRSFVIATGITAMIVACPHLQSARAEELQESVEEGQSKETQVAGADPPAPTAGDEDPAVDETGEEEEEEKVRPPRGVSESPSEPSSILTNIDRRGTQKDSLLALSPLGWLREGSRNAKDELYDATGLRIGIAMQTVFQALTDEIPGEDSTGVASTLDLLGSWELFNKGEPTAGKLVAHGQGRWDYGTRGPEELGTFSLGSAIGTADTYSAYTPAFLLRNLYWRQGSREAGWVIQGGKITPDGIVSSSAHLASETTFLPSGGTGPFAIALPDSGLGLAGIWQINENLALGGLVSDANADRFDFGDIKEGDFFKAIEFQYKFFPKTPESGFSKITLWQTDGTDDGESANGQLGPSGWGMYFKHEQELTKDGRAIGILRYGKSFNDSAIYDQQVGVHFLLYDPGLLNRLEHDVVGVAFNWAKTPVSGARDEYNFEVFYRFPLFPNVDTTFSYQSVFNPAFTSEVDHSSVFSFRIRAEF